jgi:hypothetical protein
MRDTAMPPFGRDLHRGACSFDRRLIDYSRHGKLDWSGCRCAARRLNGVSVILPEEDLDFSFDRAERKRGTMRIHARPYIERPELPQLCMI